jgi:hypothetical protein
MAMFLKAVASSKYTNIITTLQSNVDSYRHPDDEYFLPQQFCLTNIATLIHNNAKAQVHDLGHRQINRVAGWNSMSDILEDDELQFCHIQGYQPRILCITEGRDQGTGGCVLDRKGFYQQQGYDHQQDRSPTSGGRGSPNPRGHFAWPGQCCCSFLPDKQCDECKRIGHEAVNCSMLALALFIERHKQSLLDLKCNKIESTWLARWKERLGQPVHTPCQVMHTYCDVMNMTTDTLDLAMDSECWPKLDVDLSDE